MGFHLISKNVLLPAEPWGENVIGIRSFNFGLQHTSRCIQKSNNEGVGAQNFQRGLT